VSFGEQYGFLQDPSAFVFRESIPRIVTPKMTAVRTLETSGGSCLHKSTASHTVIHNSFCTALRERQMSTWNDLFCGGARVPAWRRIRTHSDRTGVSTWWHHTAIRTWACRRFEQEQTLRVPWRCHSFITGESYHCGTCGGWQTVRLFTDKTEWGWETWVCRLARIGEMIDRPRYVRLWYETLERK